MKVSTPLREIKPQFITDESGREFVIPGYHGGLGAGVTIVADRVYAQPIWLEIQTSFVKIAVEILTLAAGSVRLGLYADLIDFNQLHKPGIIVTDYGVVDVSTTGIKEIVISDTLNRGLHWLAYSSDVAPIMQGLTSAPGRVPLDGSGGNAGTTLNNIIRGAHAPGDDPLPNPFPNADALFTPAFAVAWLAPDFYA